MGSQNFEQGLTKLMVLTELMGLKKLMVLTELMGLKKLIDGSDEILADPDFKKLDPKLLWYTIAHPSLAWEEENFCIENLFIMM